MYLPTVYYLYIICFVWIYRERKNKRNNWVEDSGSYCIVSKSRLDFYSLIDVAVKWTWSCVPVRSIPWYAAHIAVLGDNSGRGRNIDFCRWFQFPEKYCSDCSDVNFKLLLNNILYLRLTKLEIRLNGAGEEGDAGVDTKGLLDATLQVLHLGHILITYWPLTIIPKNTI